MKQYARHQGGGWILLAIYAVLALSLLGTAGVIYHRWTTGQAALESRKELCKANEQGMKEVGLGKCTAENLASYIKAKDERTKAVELANATNAIAIQAQADALQANQEAVEAQAERLRRNEERTRALQGRIEQAKAQSEAARRFLAQPVPPEVEALLDAPQ